MIDRFVELWVQHDDKGWGCAGRLDAPGRFLANVFNAGIAPMVILHIEINTKSGEGNALANWKNFDGSDEDKERIIELIFGEWDDEQA